MEISPGKVAPKIPLAASTLAFRHAPLDVALRAIAAQGFRTVDLVMIPSYCPHFDPTAATERDEAELQAVLGELGLSVAALNVGDGLLGIPEQRDRCIEFVEASLRLARSLGAYTVTTQSGAEAAPGGWAAAAAAIAEDVRELAARAAALDLDLTIELHKSMLVSNSTEAADFIGLVDRPNVGIAFDTSHAVHAGEDPRKAVEALGHQIKHVHLRDAEGTNILLVPGDGTVDFAGVSAALHAIPYTRPATIELEYEHATVATAQGDLARAAAVLGAFFEVPPLAAGC
jgi:sugar phosphate isomerase/epimerase